MFDNLNQCPKISFNGWSNPTDPKLTYLLHQVWPSSPLTLFKYLWRALLAKLLHMPWEADGRPEHSPSAISHHWSMIPGFLLTRSLYASAKFWNKNSAMKNFPLKFLRWVISNLSSLRSNQKRDRTDGRNSCGEAWPGQTYQAVGTILLWSWCLGIEKSEKSKVKNFHISFYRIFL